MIKFKVTEDKQFLRIVSFEDQLELKQMKLSLTRKPKDFFYKIKKFQRFGWNGDISFIDKQLRIPIGLWNKVQDICEEFKIQYDIEGLEEIVDLDFDENDFIEWQKDFFKNSKKKPEDREFQIESAINILKWKRSVSEIATAAGKTLMIFMIFAYLKSKNKLNKMLIIVPNVQLVDQTIDAFIEYSEGKTLIDYRIQTIYSGQDKSIKNTDIIIGTFQSLRELDFDFFEGIDITCVDECHFTQTKSLSVIFKKLKKCYFRFGVSGTAKIKQDNADSFTILGLLGPQVNKISANFLIKNKFAVPVHIKMIYLNYLEEEKRKALKVLKASHVDGSKLYIYERELLINSDIRFDYIIKLMISMKTNSLVLFQDIKRGYGKRIFNKLKELMPNNVEIFYVDGSTKKDNRNYYKKMMNKTDKLRIIVASFGCFSTGIDIQNLHNIFLVESYKSETIIRQSLGRGMRVLKGKKKINIIDFIDDYSIKGFRNILYRHSVEREKIYKTEKFQIKKYLIDLK